jgi:carboxyl-terminal processing protease
MWLMRGIFLPKVARAWLKRRMKRWFAGWMLLGVCAQAEVAVPPDAEEAAYPAIERFVEVLEAVRKRHPEVDRLAYERLVNHALEGMLGSLDPHSSFIHPEMAAFMKANPEVDPEVKSLGLTLGLREDGPHIAAVAPHGAAAEAGVLPGSSLLALNGLETKGAGFSDLLESLRQAPGVKTKMRLKSLAEPKPVEVELVHRLVAEKSVAEAEMRDAEKGVGYLRLSQFGSGCAAEVEVALDELEDAGMKSLLLDLRGNGGGDLHETVKILGLFVPPSTVVVTTRGREGETEEPLKTPERQRRKRDYPISVLMDRGSASASELTAGALQDLKRATVVGEQSYGKGSVQNIIPMGGGTALRLTIATYHTPSGRTPNRVGITPDVVVEIDDAQRDMLEKRWRLDSLPPEEKKEVEAWVDPVIEKALR